MVVEIEGGALNRIENLTISSTFKGKYTLKRRNEILAVFFSSGYETCYWFDIDIGPREKLSLEVINQDSNSTIVGDVCISYRYY